MTVMKALWQNVIRTVYIHIISYYITLYYIILYYIILYEIVLYYIILYRIKLYYIILQLYCRNDRRAITMNSSKTRSLCFSQANSLRYAVVWAMPWKGLVETVIHPGYPWSMPNFVWNTRTDGLVYKAMQTFFNSPDLICCNKVNYGKIRSHVTCNIWHHSAASYTCGWRAQSTTCSR